MNIERETTNQETQPPHGTYQFLEQIGNFLFIDPKNFTRVWVLKEEVCQETGGSCMDLVIRDVGKKERHAHITQGESIVRLGAYSWDFRTTGCEELPTPDIEDMLSDVKKLLSREDIKKYPW